MVRMLCSGLELRRPAHLRAHAGAVPGQVAAGRDARRAVRRQPAGAAGAANGGGVRRRQLHADIQGGPNPKSIVRQPLQRVSVVSTALLWRCTPLSAVACDCGGSWAITLACCMAGASSGSRQQRTARQGLRSLQRSGSMASTRSSPAARSSATSTGEFDHRLALYFMQWPKVYATLVLGLTWRYRGQLRQQ